MNNVLRAMRGGMTKWLEQLGRVGVCIFLALTLSLLVACGGSGPDAGKGTGTNSPSGSTASPGAMATPTVTATPNNWAFSATVSEKFSAEYCAANQPAGSICLSGSGSGQGSPLGQFTFTRTAVMLPGGSDSCGPATMQGSLVTATGDTVSFKATGTFCRANQTAKYTYTITGGTGQFAGATGTGAVTIPTPATSTTDTQTWSGTLKYTIA